MGDGDRKIVGDNGKKETGMIWAKDKRGKNDAQFLRRQAGCPAGKSHAGIGIVRELGVGQFGSLAAWQLGFKSTK
jgi:hypothetical protein